MSNALLTQVWQLTGMEPSSKLILARLADMTNEDTGVCWPSLTRLEEETGLARSSVCRVLDALAKQGVIKRERGRLNTSYRLNLSAHTPKPKQSHHRTSPTIGLVPPSDYTSPTVGLEVVPPSDQSSPTIGPEPKENPKDNPKEPKEVCLPQTTEPPPFHSPEFLEAWAMWEKERKDRRKKLTPQAIRLQFRSLRGMGHDRAIAAIYNSIEKGYTGIFEPSPSRTNGHRHPAHHAAPPPADGGAF